MGVHGDGYKDLMKEDGTYGALGVLFDGGKWYLWCIGCVVTLFGGEVNSGGGLVMCMGRNVRVDVCSNVCIWIELLIFCLAGCFVMGGW